MQWQTVYVYNHFMLLTTTIVFPVLLATDLPDGDGHKLISLVLYRKPSPPFYPIHKPWGIDNGVVTEGLKRQHTFLGYISDPVSVAQVSESELGPSSHESLVSNQLS